MIRLNNIDYFTFAIYFLVFTAIGLVAGRKKKTNAAEFFIQQDRLPWYIIGFSFITAGISSEQFIGTVGSVYGRGLVIANWEWGNAVAVVVMVVLFIPYYLKKRILTIPEFLEKRFNRKVSLLFAVISILIYVFINLTGVLYSGAFAMSGILGIDLYICILIITLIVGFFTIYGGMASIAWTNVMQAVMLIGSGIAIFIIGLYTVPGGWNSIIGTGPRAHLIQPVSDPDIPWTAILVLMFSTNIWYYCTSQNINQATLGARNEWHAKMGIIFAGILWIFIPLGDVFPGLIAHALEPNLPKPDNAFVFVISRLIPAGGAGVIYGVLIFAVVAAIQSGINGISSIFTFDIYRPLLKPKATEKNLIKTGRYFAAAILITAAFYAPIVGSFKHIFDFFQECWAFIAVPISLTFLLSMVSKRMNSKLAFNMLLLTLPMFFVPYVVRQTGITMNIYNLAGILWICLLLGAAVYLYLFVPKPAAGIVILSDVVVSDIEIIPMPWYKTIAFWITIMVVAYLTVYIIFW
jgi:solute:Na+ symporter, SSS family